jgi:hypothetical protein
VRTKDCPEQITVANQKVRCEARGKHSTHYGSAEAHFPSRSVDVQWWKPGTDKEKRNV